MAKHIHVHLHRGTRDHLVASGSPGAMSANIKTEMAAGKPQAQAVAIAESEKRKAGHDCGCGGATADDIKRDGDGKFATSSGNAEHHEAAGARHMEEARTKGEKHPDVPVHRAAHSEHLMAASHLKQAAEPGADPEHHSARAEVSAQGAKAHESRIPGHPEHAKKMEWYRKRDSLHPPGSNGMHAGKYVRELDKTKK